MPLTKRSPAIKGWLYSPDQKTRKLKPAAIICHGIPGGRPENSDRGYLPLAEVITAAGYHCILFNFRGCGESEGNIDMRGWLEDLNQILFKTLNLPGIDASSIHCIGFSAGGAIAAKALSMNKEIASLLLMATPAEFAPILPTDAGLLRQHFVDIGLIRDIGFPPDIRSWYNDFMELRTEYWINYIAPRPVCIVHGSDDELVPVSHAQRLYEACGCPRELKILEGAAHQLRKDPRTTATILNWLKEVA